MQLRFPVEMKAIVRELHETHLFDGEGERIVGSQGDGPRLKECRLRVAFEMQATKTYSAMPPPRPASTVLERSKRRFKETTGPEKKTSLRVCFVADDSSEYVKVPVERPGKRSTHRYIVIS